MSVSGPLRRRRLEHRAALRLCRAGAAWRRGWVRIRSITPRRPRRGRRPQSSPPRFPSTRARNAKGPLRPSGATTSSASAYNRSAGTAPAHIPSAPRRLPGSSKGRIEGGTLRFLALPPRRKTVGNPLRSRQQHVDHTAAEASACEEQRQDNGCTDEAAYEERGERDGSDQQGPTPGRSEAKLPVAGNALRHAGPTTPQQGPELVGDYDKPDDG